MGISDFDKLTPAHLVQVIISTVLLIVCIFYFSKEVIREFPYIKEILKGTDKDE